MTILSIAAVMGLSAACQKVVDPATIARIAQHESGLQSFALHDNTTGRSYVPETKPDAYRLAEGLITAGHSVDVGLTQINVANFNWLGLSLTTALDPCANIHASATVLTAYSRYNTGSPTRGMGYAMAVQAVRVADAQPTHTAPDHMLPPCPSDDDDGWHTVARPAGCIDHNTTESDNEDK